MSGIMFWFSVALVFYVYLGYPILVVLLAHLRKPLTYSANYFPTVTLIFAANNEERIIARKLENSLLLDYPQEKLQILIADDGSVDQTPEIAMSFQGRGVEVVSFHRRRGKLAALNDAIKNARGEIFLFSDADNFFPPDALKEAVKYFQNPSIGAVSGGRNVIGDSMLGGAESLYWKYEEFIKRQESRLGSCVGVAGDLLAVRKMLFVSPPVGIINDDFYMAMGVLKQGYRVIYAPAARSFHPVAETESGEAERRARMVAGRYQAVFSAWRMLPFKNPIALWQIISHKYLRPLVPFAMIAALIANLVTVLKPLSITGSSLLLLSHPYDQIFLILQIIFYGIALIGMRFRLGGFIGKIIYLPAFLVNSNLAALRGFYRYISSNQTVVWKKADR
jgi:cellulose synthase/poly-beta-1,6-N-acetylglucosamine synthase-like glycosyltransferase